ncbi:MAG: hypothetical protein DLM50_03385 [Candidatus Meridianibacter frigidus]|nr:MAG: hypothetical protein DLM50_03385 [Candidatus Eremiobacteraeota bacterium]
MKTLALVLAIILFVLALLAWSGIAAFLPALGIDGTHHLKHGILYFVLGILCLVWMRFSASAPTEA